MKTSLSLFVAVIVGCALTSSVYAQTSTQVGTSAATSSNSDSSPSFFSSLFNKKNTKDIPVAPLNSSLEEIRGVIEGVGTDRLPINIKTDNGLSIRVIRFGNKDSIKVTRDDKAVTSIDELQPGDAVIVKYGPLVAHEGTLAEGTSASKIVLKDSEGRTQTFSSFDKLSLRYIFSQDDKAVVGATVEGKAGITGILPTLKIGTPVTITYNGESIYSVDAYSSGNIPGVSKENQVTASSDMSDRNKKLLGLSVLGAIILGALGYRKYRNRI